MKRLAEIGQHAQRSSWSVQQHFYEEECDPEFEINRPHGCGRLYEFLIGHKLRTGLATLGCDIVGRTVLEICCGSGMMSEKFVRAGAEVTGADFSASAVARAEERSRRYRFDARFMVADAENLGFPDRSFDFVAVHDGLHHLDNPEHAIREMARVARRGVLIMDPARAALTRLAILMGVAVQMEDAGNEVKRLVPGDVAAILRSEGYETVRWRRTLMYYPHQPPAWFERFDKTLAFVAFRVLFSSANVVLGRWGNKLALAALRDARTDRPRRISS
jgi:SAM-dependent methyltransferase